MTVVFFPSCRFRPADRSELERWGAIAPSVGGWWVQEDAEGQVIGTTDEGSEFAALVHGGPREEGGYIVEPDRKGWKLIYSSMGLVGTFRTLREALESVCRTIHEAA